MQAVKDKTLAKAADRMKSVIARNIKASLQERGLSQSDLARATGLTFNFISDVVTGEHMPNIAALVTIARALDTSVDSLITA